MAESETRESGVELIASGHPERFGWRRGLRYDAFFSIGSSLAFTMLVLLFGWWRLTRIGF